VREVYIDDDSRDATVVVPDDQLALAIGKEGLNARLAARLTGWKVDIVSDTEFAQQEAEAAFGGEGDADFTGRCAAILANGKRCPNAALPGTRFCGVAAHQELAKIEAETGEYAPHTVTPTSAEPEDEEAAEVEDAELEPARQTAANEAPEPVGEAEAAAAPASDRPAAQQHETAAPASDLPVAEQDENEPSEPVETAAYESEGTAPAA
jgi:N utilization substance protein A